MTVVSLDMAYRSFRGGSGRLRHPPRYAAYLTPSSPSFPHNSVSDRTRPYTAPKPGWYAELSLVERLPEGWQEAPGGRYASISLAAARLSANLRVYGVRN